MEYCEISELQKAIENQLPTVGIYSATVEEITDALSIINCNNPHIYWFSNQFIFDESSRILHLFYCSSTPNFPSSQNGLLNDLKRLISLSNTDHFADKLPLILGTLAKHYEFASNRICEIIKIDRDHRLESIMLLLKQLSLNDNDITDGFRKLNYFNDDSLALENYSYVSLPKTEIITSKISWWKRLFRKENRSEIVNATAYAPTETYAYKDFLVEVYIHKPEDGSFIDSLVESMDAQARKKAQSSLYLPINIGDKVSVKLIMTGGVKIENDFKSFIWQGRYNSLRFLCKLENPRTTSVSATATILVNNVPCGELIFIINTIPVESAVRYTKVIPRKYSKIFISYAHKDLQQVKGIAEGCKINGIDFFFDLDKLKAGDKYEEIIFNYLDKADLFVLCWSKNAAESEWVTKERQKALELIEKGHDLSIWSIIIPPEAEPPLDMIKTYHFSKI